MKQFTMVHLYSEHYESFYHESEEAIVVMHTDKRSGQSFWETRFVKRPIQMITPSVCKQTVFLYACTSFRPTYRQEMSLKAMIYAVLGSEIAYMSRRKEYKLIYTKKGVVYNAGH